MSMGGDGSSRVVVVVGKVALVVFFPTMTLIMIKKNDGIME